jgi:hypothetical protein
MWVVPSTTQKMLSCSQINGASGIIKGFGTIDEFGNAPKAHAIVKIGGTERKSHLCGKLAVLWKGPVSRRRFQKGIAPKINNR